MDAARRIAPNPSEPPADGAAAARERLAVSREHAFLSLLELSRELTFSLDLVETVDLLLFNLMGQFGCARSALWLLADRGENRPILLRSHGFKPEILRAVGNACHPLLQRRLEESRAPILTWLLQQGLDAHEFELLQQSGISVIAPLAARGELLGWIALGASVNNTTYSASELQVLETALGMVAVSLQNSMLYMRVQETNRKLVASNGRLQELDRLKTQFLSNVNHELRTPLTVIIASLECVLEPNLADVRTKSLMQGALQHSRNLETLLENLLMFSEALQHRLPVQVAPGDLGALAERFASERRPGITADLRRIECEVAEDLPKAAFDAVRLHQILDQLVDNAVKFTPRGTRLVLRVERTNDGGGGWLVLELEDDGPGIPPDRMGSLFSSFEQVDGSMVRQVGGLGMGLAFASQLAQRMGCTLRARSVVGQGTTFSLEVPVAE